MTGLWVVAGVALAVAVAAWLKARRAARRLGQLSEMYWELKYQHGELRNAVMGNPAQQTTSDLPAAAQGAKVGDTSPAPSHAPAAPSNAFIPLKSLRR